MEDWEHYRTAEMLWEDCIVDKITVEDWDDNEEFIPKYRAYQGLTIARKAWLKERKEVARRIESIFYFGSVGVGKGANCISAEGWKKIRKRIDTEVLTLLSDCDKKVK